MFNTNTVFFFKYLCFSVVEFADTVGRPHSSRFHFVGLCHSLIMILLSALWVLIKAGLGTCTQMLWRLAGNSQKTPSLENYSVNWANYLKIWLMKLITTLPKASPETHSGTNSLIGFDMKNWDQIKSVSSFSSPATIPCSVLLLWLLFS